MHARILHMEDYLLPEMQTLQEVFDDEGLALEYAGGDGAIDGGEWELPVSERFIM